MENISNYMTAKEYLALDTVLPTSNVNTNIQSVIVMQSTEEENSGEEGDGDVMKLLIKILQGK